MNGDWRGWKLIVAGVHSEPCRHVIALEFVTATGAELVCRPDGAEAVSATCGELVITLRAEMEVALDVGAAGGALGNERRTQGK